MNQYVDERGNVNNIGNIVSVGAIKKAFPEFDKLEYPLLAGVQAYCGVVQIVDLADGDVCTGNAVKVDGQWLVEYRSFTVNELAVAAKVNRAEQVAVIKVTTVSGKEFDGDEHSQNRMARAVTAGSAGDSTMWRLADDSWVNVTWEELKEALRLAGEAQTAVWNI
jgi:hypothetical protein